MERLEKFQIIFNNPTATYCVGDTVYGYGWVIIKEPLFVQSVCLEAVGEAKVEWMTSSDIQASDEEVFNYTTVLPIKSDKGSDEDLLNPGSHYFPFEFTLPSKLPSSFKGKHGRLRYFVRMTICTPGGPHHERTSKFAVISSLDLNAEPDAALPVESDTFEVIGSFCCISGTVTAHIKLPKKGYTVKEAIPVWAEIKNLSTRRINSTRVSLIQNVTFYSFRGRFSESSVLVTIHKGGIAPRGKQTWQKELLSIPTVPPSHLKGCKIIDIQYNLEHNIGYTWRQVLMVEEEPGQPQKRTTNPREATGKLSHITTFAESCSNTRRQLCIKPSGLGRKVKIPLDIIIGTVPLQGTTQHKASYHPLPSIVSENSCPFPFFENVSDQVMLTEYSFQQQLLPTAPPWEEDDDIP